MAIVTFPFSHFTGGGYTRWRNTPSGKEYSHDNGITLPKLKPFKGEWDIDMNRLSVEMDKMDEPPEEDKRTEGEKWADEWAAKHEYEHEY